MVVREVQRAAEIDDGDRARFSQVDQALHGPAVAADGIGQDDRQLRLGEHLRDLTQRRWITLKLCWHRELRDVGDGDRLLELLLLPPRVERQIHRAARLRHHGAIRAHEGFGEARRIVWLVVPLHVVAHQVALHQRRVHPVDPGAPLRHAHRPGAAHDHDRRPGDPRLVDRHRCVHGAHYVVHAGDGRLAARLGVSDRHGDGDLFVQALDYLGRLVVPVVHDRVEQPAIGAAQVQRRVLDAIGLHHVDRDVGSPLR